MSTDDTLTPPTPTAVPSTPPPTADTATQAAAELDALRSDFNALADSDALDKPTALTVARLFHAMEALLMHERAARERDVAALRHELERAHLQGELDRLARRHTLDEVQIHQMQEKAPRTRRGL